MFMVPFRFSMGQTQTSSGYKKTLASMLLTCLTHIRHHVPSTLVGTHWIISWSCSATLTQTNATSWLTGEFGKEVLLCLLRSPYIVSIHHFLLVISFKCDCTLLLLLLPNCFLMGGLCLWLVGLCQKRCFSMPGRTLTTSCTSTTGWEQTCWTLERVCLPSCKQSGTGAERSL